MRSYTPLTSTARLLLALAVVIGGAAALVGCDTVGSGASSDEEGRLRVLLTDAPGDILEAHVTITRVAIVPANDSADGDAGEGGLEVLSEDSVTVDLVELQNGVTETLGDVTIPAGTYGQIRLVTAREATVYYEDADGEARAADLKLPSADETGIKINFEPFTVDEATGEIEVTLDFDVEKSFVKAGASGTYVFKPVVHAQSVVVDGDTLDSDAG